MPSDSQSSFGPFRFDYANSRLRHGNTSQHLQPKACEVLKILIENKGNVVRSQYLLDHVWGQDKFGTKGLLEFQIWKLRAALGRYGKSYRQYIKNVSGKGYRFQVEDPVDKPSSQERVLVASDKKSPNPKKSLAVLPFGLVSQRIRDEALEDDMTYSLTAKLSDISQILVTPLATVRSFALNTNDPIAIGLALGVDAIVQGSIRRAPGNKIRGTVRLIRVSDASQLWAKSFDEKFRDILKLKASICQKLAENLIHRLTREERSRMAKQDTESPEAASLYVAGRNFWNERTDEGLQKAINCFKQAIEIDPDYALAYAGLADSFNLRSYYGGIRPSDTFRQALSWAEDALKIDRQLAEAHCSRAYAISRCFWNWDEAENEYSQAISLKPNYATAHQWYAEHLTAMGRFDDAIIEVGHALECDRHSPIINAALGTVLYFSQRYDEAVKQYQRTIKKTPSFVRAHFRLARALVQTGRFTEAIAECKKGLRLSQIKTREIAQLGQVYAMADKFDLALKVLKQLEELSKEYYVSEYNTALIYVAMGADEQAFQWLDRACFSRDPWLEHLNVDPRLAALRTDSRFQVLLKRVYLIR